MSQLRDLAKPFDARLIQSKPGRSGGSYVSHGTVVERALAVLGAYSIKSVELIRGHAVEEQTKNKTFPAEDGVVVGALVTISCMVDGREIVIVEVGDVENPLQKGNDGARAKDAVSDGIKRCFMRLGLGLHLWSQDAYVLDRVLERNERSAATPPEAPQKPIAPQQTDPEPTAPEKPAQPQDKATWEGWRSKDDPVLWAADQTDDHGAALFGHHQHAQNSYDKAKREYLNSLEKDARPKDGDSHEAKWKHAKALNAYFFEKVQAKKRGEEFVLQTAGSQRIFEDIGEGDGVPFEAVGA